MCAAIHACKSYTIWKFKNVQDINHLFGCIYFFGMLTTWNWKIQRIKYMYIIFKSRQYYCLCYFSRLTATKVKFQFTLNDFKALCEVKVLEIWRLCMIIKLAQNNTLRALLKELLANMRISWTQYLKYILYSVLHTVCHTMFKLYLMHQLIIQKKN